LKARNGHATWLELVSIGQDPGGEEGGRARVRLLARRGAGRVGCAGIVLLIDDRPLVSNDGQQTMFCDAAAARRFLELARIRDYEFAEGDAVNACRYHEAHCLSLSRSGLSKCSGCAARGKGTRAA